MDSLSINSQTTDRRHSFQEENVRLDFFAEGNIYRPDGSYYYDGEKVAKLKAKIMQLLADLFPPQETERPTIRRLGQGAYNMVVGVSVIPKIHAQKSDSSYSARVTRLLGSPPKPQTFALRIPVESWFDVNGHLGSIIRSDIHQDVATLCVLGQRLPVPIPTIKEFDVTEINALRRSYMLQNFIPGESLVKLWHEMNLDQKASAVRQLTRIVEAIASITSPAAGQISFENITSPSSEIKLDQILIPTADQAHLHPKLNLLEKREAPHQTPCQFLIDCCNRWMRYEALIGPPDGFRESLWYSIIEIIHVLDDMGWLGDRFHLMHGDLFARNVMVEISSRSSVKITGIVDWDMACFVPKIIALRSPFWAWKGIDYDESDENKVAQAPSDRVGKALRTAFLSTASQEYVTMTLEDEGVIARKLYNVVTGGLLTSRERTMAARLIQHWNVICPKEHPSRVRKSKTVH
ncbi:hypothetical protein COCC4DRAFT_154622 [Bipolaris maydis ATCC 48331]|uniref:Aminoglycoside phosphotransferase domain-containing protein n=2 Tax=Cochliobolus heterostrophus TaxID=5016 RepID=M2UAE7_COCH5|nr:uncharacterized protein COCC4DRAFT_154622 [Bipolaris maydis ATCC 48331]EMD84917.1 hypothetical protein COCHEDRAFT_1120662 [Bipolaris maydis C5]KAJ5059266.1 hypothetical protein J3E74DRAFT_218409 [Bipolaris maydis]ENH98915.1 hypothetical protein COCC4DRAFT_154622 [Bipolaris maydis ATCC 48331]KAJ6209247.1 hypothetical protein PSV09DRAFT_1120662 [Bipolaris maydis]KAJ6271731.1 hypothetical protein PSV08DRAFT_178507 [Bipolaris maydis]